MGLLDLFRRKQELTEAQKIALHATLTAESNRTLSDREDAALLGINLEMIRDEGVEWWLDKLARAPMDMGSLYPNWSVLALRMMASPLRRTFFLPREDATIELIENRRFARQLKMELPEHEYESGLVHFIYALRKLMDSAVYDSISGQKALLMKATTRSMEVSVPQQKQKPQERSFP